MKLYIRMAQPVVTIYVKQEKSYCIFGFVKLIAKKLPEMVKTTPNLGSPTKHYHLFG